MDQDGTQIVTAQQEVYLYLRERIFSGKLKAGTRLNPALIAGELNCSRMPVREALRQLDSEGFVTIRPNRGAVVMILTPESIEEIFQIRVALETLAVRLAVPHIDIGVIGELENLQLKMELANKNLIKWVQWHDQFHDVLYGHSQRPRLTNEIKRFRTLIHPYMMRYCINVNRTPEKTAVEHSVILAAVRSGNAALAETAVRDHLMSAASAATEFLTREKTDSRQ